MFSGILWSKSGLVLGLKVASGECEKNLTLDRVETPISKNLFYITNKISGCLMTKWDKI